MRIPNFMFPHSATIREFLGNSAYGVQYKDATTIRCRIEPMTKKVVKSNGTEVTSTATLFIPSTVTLPTESEVVCRGTKYTVLSNVPFMGTKGVMYYEVALS